MRIPLLKVVLLLCFAATSAAAQVLPIPREDPQADRRRFRAESLRGAQEALIRWTAAWAGQDARAAAALHTEAGHLLLPGQTAPVQGARAIEQTLSAYLAQAGPLSISLVDAEAGGNLVYMYGRYYYEPRPGVSDAAPPLTTGSYVAILQQRGRDWRIRSLFFLAEPIGEAVESLP
ncbi:MAG TPA: nuclear transport factor 2 family protein [Longimicrobiaceae bacterium]|nr:nuclear transport factor 2 family protein [Longimicrobiaceae bacterium]